jgi:lysophospholipase L1-like esterase
MFDAQWSVVAHSGQGMVKNLSEGLSDIETNVTMADEFMMSHFPGQGTASDWDFTSWQPDVLVITLGTNDFSWVPWDKTMADPEVDFTEETRDQFEPEYQAFLEKARGLYPDATIFALGTFLASGTNQFAQGNEWICSAVDAVGDPNMYCLDPGYTGETWVTGPGDYIGDWTHPHTEGNTKIANGLANHVGMVMGW